MGTATDSQLSDRDVHEVDVDGLRSHLCVRVRLQDVEHARALAERLEELPPIIVHRESNTIIDGNHRVLAARLLQRRTVRAVFFDGSADEAYVEAIRANISHGKPLSLVERQSGAIEVLARFPEWSDRRIANACGLSATTVGRVRARHQLPDRAVDRREGRDGRVRRVTRARPAITVEARPANSANGAWRSELESMLGARLVDDRTLSALIDDIPVGYAYDVAARARQCADAWRRFADALDDKARSRR